ncbi:MAG: sugar phosphate isomerase/epimerase, partial [Anaerolineales bacterium]|nr:sugar phosphate isomerase/epimerase [Anaerolineales bacterium]
CLDVGHVYLTDSGMREFLQVMGGRIVHLHLQDLLSAAEVGLPVPTVDHYLPGTGRIPSADWRLLVERLKELDYVGTAVFEIRPRNPYQNSILGARFFDDLL